MITELGPFTCFEIFKYTAPHMEPKDIGRLAGVCRQYREWATAPAIWEQVSEREGVPLVAGEGRNRKNDFGILYPVTISGKMIGEVFGKVVGKVPPISE